MSSGNIPISAVERTSGGIAPRRKRPKAFSRKSPGEIVFDIINGFLLVLFCVTIIYPFWTPSSSALPAGAM